MSNESPIQSLAGKSRLRAGFSINGQALFQLTNGTAAVVLDRPGYRFLSRPACYDLVCICQHLADGVTRHVRSLQTDAFFNILMKFHDIFQVVFLSRDIGEKVVQRRFDQYAERHQQIISRGPQDRDVKSRIGFCPLLE